MRILFVVPTLNCGGAERHTLDVARGLIQRGHSVRIQTVKNSQPLITECSQYESLSCVTQSIESRRYIDPASAIRLANAINVYQPNVVVSVNFYGMMYASVAILMSKWSTSHVTVSHSTLARSLLERIQNSFIYGPLVRSTDLLVYLCNAQWRATKWKATRSAIIHNGIDTSVFNERQRLELRNQARASYGFQADEVVIGICAMLRPEKNHFHFLEALGELIRQGYPCRGLVLGDGPLLSSLQSHCGRLNLGDKVVFAGKRTSVLEHISAFDFGVLPSTTETFSLAALEQMGMGIPMVLSDVGAASEMVTDLVDGRIVPPDCLKSLIAGIRWLLDHQNRSELSRINSEKVSTRFSRESMIDKYEMVFKAASVRNWVGI